MVGLLKKIALIICVILVVTFIIVNNHTDTSLIFWPGKSIKTGLGIVLIATFVIGFVIAAIIGSYFSFKSYLKEKKLLKDKDKKETIEKKVSEARIYSCLKDYPKALNLWHEILRRNKNVIIPYIEIAKIYLDVSKYQDALDTLKEAQKIKPNNEEVLFYLAKAHGFLKNNASCLENFARIYSTRPCAYIANLACNQAISIEQFDDALEYNENLTSLLKDKKNELKIDNKDREIDIEYKKILKETLDASKEQIEALQKLHKDAPFHIATGLKLASIFSDQNDIKSCTQVLTKLALNSKKAFVWRKIIQTWLKNQEPKKVISTINTALKETTGKELIKSYFIAIESYANLAMLDDARAYFEMFEKYVKDNNISLSKNEKLLFDFSYAMLFNNKNVSSLDLFSLIDNE